MSKRKVKPPVKARKAAQKRAEEKKLENLDVGSGSTGVAGTGKFFGVGILVILGIAAIGAAAYYLPKTEWLKADTKPWLSYESRIKEPDEGSPYYEYRAKEVEHWVDGVRQNGIKADDLAMILRRADKWLSLPDATRILEAAHAAQPGHKTLVTEHARKLREKAQPSNAEERACRARLDRLINLGREPE
tara:strand:+ start:49415 stop:49981 length:567 start_codon:yes stop_codon:yes gene_type:complete